MTIIVLSAAMLPACVPASADLILTDGATHDLNSAVAGDGVEVLNSTTVNLLTSGSIDGFLDASNNSTVNTSGGSIGTYLWAWDDSTVTFSGSTIG